MSDTMDKSTEDHRKAIIGDVDSSFWLYDSLTGFDLTHPLTPSSPLVSNAVRIETAKLPITIDPAKSAIIIIDMQNFFLSPALGRPRDSKGLEAQKQLLRYAIPAARKAGIRVVWLNWGLDDEELKNLPAAIRKALGFETVKASDFESYLADKIRKSDLTSDPPKPTASNINMRIETLGKHSKIYQGMGNQMGTVTLDDGSEIDAGRQLTRHQWNSALTPALDEAYREGLKCSPPDVLIHKNRMSGLWGSSTSCTDYLDMQGVTTLFFAGVNTDQCVGASLTDAFVKGYDCILLSDGAATSSPVACQEAYEFNAAGTFGFCTTCKDLWEAVEAKNS